MHLCELCNACPYNEYCIVDIFRYQALKAYLRRLIFVVCPEHVIIVAYCLDFRAFLFLFWALRNENSKNKPNEFPAICTVSKL